jgi:hypothetical protein
MGRRTREYQWQLPAGRLPRQAVGRCSVAHTDSYAYANSNCNTHCYCDCDCDRNGNCGSKPNSYSYSKANSHGHRNSHCHSYGNSNGHSYSNGNGYCNSHTEPNHTYGAWLSSKRATESGPDLEWRDFESRRHLP